MKIVLLLTIVAVASVYASPVREGEEEKRFLLDDLKAAAAQLQQQYQSGGVTGVLTGLVQSAHQQLSNLKQTVQTVAAVVDATIHQAGSSSKRFLLDDVKAAVEAVHQQVQAVQQQYQTGGLTGVLSGLVQAAQTGTETLKQAVMTAAGTVHQAVAGGQ